MDSEQRQDKRARAAWAVRVVDQLLVGACCALVLVACGGTDDDGTGAAAAGGAAGAGAVGGGGTSTAGSGGAPGGGSAEAGTGGTGGSCPLDGPYDILDQEPSCLVPYPGSLWAKPLPDDVMAHLAPSSAAIAACTATDCGAAEPSSYGNSVLSTPGTNDWTSMPRYYGNADDPFYLLDSCGPDTGTVLRIPSGACLSKSQDHGIGVWDQTSNKTMGIYAWSEDEVVCLPACTGMTEQTACPLGLGDDVACGVSDYTNGPAYADGVEHWTFGAGSLGNAPWSLLVRHRELTDGVILHPLFAVVKCTVGHVFPAPWGTYECSELGEPEGTRPPTGSLFFLDYSDAEIEALDLPAWQAPLVRAAARYGIYVSDTNAYDGTTFSLGFEGGGAYEQAGTISPVYQWLEAQGVTPVSSAGYDRYFLPFLANLPDVASHLHLADPCVARAQAGLEDGCL